MNKIAIVITLISGGVLMAHPPGAVGTVACALCIIGLIIIMVVGPPK